MNKEQFYQYLHYPELLDDRSLEDIEGILTEYPYFQSARLLNIKNLNNQGSISYDRELKRVAVWVTDRSKLFYLLDNRVLLPVNEYVSKENIDLDNGITLDFSALTEVTSFDSGEVKEIVLDEQNDELSQLIMSGSAQASTFFNVNDKVDLTDFVNTFKKRSSSEKQDIESTDIEDKHHKKLIDNFIIDQPKISQQDKDYFSEEATQPLSSKEESVMITDTLAKIYISQGKYEKAILAYEKLSLKYPEKNIYFVGQIKKIKQLINNQ